MLRAAASGTSGGRGRGEREGPWKELSSQVLPDVAAHFHIQENIIVGRQLTGDARPRFFES